MEDAEEEEEEGEEEEEEEEGEVALDGVQLDFGFDTASR